MKYKEDRNLLLEGFQATNALLNQYIGTDGTTDEVSTDSFICGAVNSPLSQVTNSDTMRCIEMERNSNKIHAK